MTESLAPGSPQAVALDALLARLERVEAAIRGAEAERVQLLAAAFELATVENDVEGAVPSGAGAELAYRAIRAELAAVLHESEAMVERRMDRAVTLTRHYPGVFEAYRAGRISERHATVITDAGAVIGAGGAAAEGDSIDGAGEESGEPPVEHRRAAYERAVLPVAEAETPTRLRPVARCLAEEHARVSLDERHATARADRRVWVQDRDDGMADLYAHLPAAEAYAIKNRLTRLAKQQARTEAEAEAGVGAEAGRGAETGAGTGASARVAAPHETVALGSARRSQDQIRADLLADLLLGRDLRSCGDGTSCMGGMNCADDANGAGGAGDVGGGGDGAAGDADGVRVAPSGGARAARTPPEYTGSTMQAAVQVIVGAHTLRLPELEGYGPIDSATARDLAGAASHWEMIRTDPGTGEVLSVERYRPSEEMRRLLRARDQHCRFPGCRAPVWRCDIDHTIDAALGGPTTVQNLAHLCRGHHTLKHHTGWRVTQTKQGVLRWTAPTGRRYDDHPPGQTVHRASTTRTGTTRTSAARAGTVRVGTAQAGTARAGTAQAGTARTGGARVGGGRMREARASVPSASAVSASSARRSMARTSAAGKGTARASTAGKSTSKKSRVRFEAGGARHERTPPDRPG